MDMSLEKWISELEMDDYNFIDQCETNFTGFNTVDEFAQLVTPPGESLQQSSSSESHSCCPTLNLKSDTNTSTNPTAAFSGSSVEISETGFERPTKQMKTSILNKSVTEEVSPKTSSTNPQQLLHESLENTSEPKDEVVSNGELSFPPKAGQKRSNTTTRTPSEAQERVIAERKRRETLSQRFIALSAIVPGLKKIDKASILGDAIKYLKQLEEQVKLLEGKINKTSEESVVFVKKCQFSADNDTSSCDENFDANLNEALPEIEVRISEKNVLIRIHCEEQKGFAVKLLGAIEKVHLTVVSSNFLPFGPYAMDITVVAQMEAGFCMTVKDLVRNLRSAFLKFM